MKRIGLGLSLVAAGFVTAVMITVPAIDASAQMGSGGMQGQSMMQHGAETPATQAYMAALMRMHNDMAIQFTGNPDVDFARGMIPHHQGAIDLSRVVLQYGRDPEIRALAEKIIKDQEEEIGSLRQWLEHQGQQGQTGQGYSMPMMGPGMMPGMGAGSMMGMGPMMGGPGQHIEGRIAFLRTELKINNAQAQLFDTYADALRAAASSMQDMHNQMWSGSMPTTLPERLERQEQMMTAYLDALKKIRAAAVPLYNALSPEQKQSADTLMGMMGGLW